MTKQTLLVTWALVIAVIPVLNVSAVAQDQSMHPQTQQNLKEMAAVMAGISNQLSTGKMSSDAQKTAALITEQVSQILHELSGPGKADHHGHKNKVVKMKKDWDPWGEDDEGGSTD